MTLQPDLCSARCEIVTRYAHETLLYDTVKCLPREMISLITQYSLFSREDETEFQTAYFQHQWTMLTAVENNIFYSIAYSTTLYQFARQSLANQELNFTDITNQIETLYHPLIAPFTVGGFIAPVSPLDLPRFSPLPYPDGFDPETPERWGNFDAPAASTQLVDVRINPGNNFDVMDLQPPIDPLEEIDTTSLALTTYTTVTTLYCPLVFRTDPSKLGPSMRNAAVGARQIQIAILPLCRVEPHRNFCCSSITEAIDYEPRR